VREVLEDRDDILDCFRMNLLRAQQQTKYADFKRREVEFKVDDLVLINLRSYWPKSLANRLNEKLAPQYFGPYNTTRWCRKLKGSLSSRTT
jgi:hypothetical protein